MISPGRLFGFAAILAGLVGVPWIAEAQADRRLPDARVGEPYTYSFDSTGLVEPVEYRFVWVGSRPEGFTTTGARLHGTPLRDRAEPHLFDVIATDALGSGIKQTFGIVIRPPLQPLVLLTNAFPSITVGEPVDIPIATRGGEGPLFWTIDDEKLLPGLSIACGGNRQGCRLQGSPEEPGTFSAVVSVRNMGTRVGPTVVTGSVRDRPPPPLEICTTELPSGFLGIAYQQQLCALGGRPPYDWSLSWAEDLPVGMYFDEASGILAGTPTGVGSYSARISVSDQSTSAQTDFDFAVRSKPADGDLKIFPPQLPVAVVGEPYRAELVLLNRRGAVEWETADSSLPDWADFSIDGYVGLITGLPPEAGSWEFTLVSRDIFADVTPPSKTLQQFGRTETVRRTIRAILNLSEDPCAPLQEAESQSETPLLSFDNRTHLSQIQARLSELGLYRRRIDGIWGPGTREALRRFREITRLPTEDSWDHCVQYLLFDD